MIRPLVTWRGKQISWLNCIIIKKFLRTFSFYRCTYQQNMSDQIYHNVSMFVHVKMHSVPENFINARPKKLFKSNKSISRNFVWIFSIKVKFRKWNISKKIRQIFISLDEFLAWTFLNILVRYDTYKYMSMSCTLYTIHSRYLHRKYAQKHKTAQFNKIS